VNIFAVSNIGIQLLRGRTAASGPNKMVCAQRFNLSNRQLAGASLRQSVGRATVSRRSNIKPIAFVEGEKKAVGTTDGQATIEVPIKISVPLRVKYGEHLRLVGNHELLGGWEIDHAPELACSEDGNFWSTTLSLPAGLQAEYKLIHVIPGRPPVWEYIPNRMLDVTDTPTTMQLIWCDLADTVPVAAEEIEMRLANPPEEAESPPITGFEIDKDAAISEAITVATVVPEQEAQPIEEEDKPTPELVVEENADDIVPTVHAVVETAEPEVDDAPATGKFLKGAAKTAGYVALGVAGAAVLSALAIDVTDAAVMGAMAAAAGSAAMTSKGAAGKKTLSGDGESEAADDDGTEGEEVPERRITGAGEAGVIIAAGLMSALDVGKAMAKSLDATSEAKASGEELESNDGVQE
jgi:hypothetical protein